MEEDFEDFEEGEYLASDCADYTDFYFLAVCQI